MIKSSRPPAPCSLRINHRLVINTYGAFAPGGGSGYKANVISERVAVSSVHDLTSGVKTGHGTKYNTVRKNRGTASLHLCLGTDAATNIPCGFMW